MNRLDPEADAFTFQIFSDRGKGPAQILHGSFDNLANNLSALNHRGAGIFVTVNETDLKGRTASNIKRIRAVFADLDGAPLEPVLQCAIQPSMIVESSPGRYHAYWSVDGLPLNQFEGVQRTIAERFNADKSCIDLPRVLRLPGFLHQKKTHSEPGFFEIPPSSPAPPRRFWRIFRP
ncbi:MAG: DNA-primase RepB domain-containing protein [Methylococcales bacterium]